MVNETTVLTTEHNTSTEGKKPSIFSSIKNKCRKIYAAITTALVMNAATAVSAFASAPAASSGTSSGGMSGANQGDQMFTELIKFFAKWIGRIGLVVAFVGAIMFALAIRSEDAEGKTRGLLTLASGFIVFAVTLSLDLFGIV